MWPWRVKMPTQNLLRLLLLVMIMLRIMLATVCSKCFGRRMSSKLSQLDSWQQKNTSTNDVIGWLKYFAGYNPQLCLRVNVKPSHSRVIQKIFVLRIAFITINGKASHVSVFGRHKHGADAWILSEDLNTVVSSLPPTYKWKRTSITKRGWGGDYFSHVFKTNKKTNK